MEQLALSLAKYTDYLETSKKKMKLHHTLTFPVRVLADNIQFQFLPVRGSVPCTLLEGLDAQLGEVPDCQSVLVEDVCPTDYRTKYKFIQTMKNIGFEFQAALLTYTQCRQSSLCVEGECSK